MPRTRRIFRSSSSISLTTLEKLRLVRRAIAAISTRTLSEIRRLTGSSLILHLHSEPSAFIVFQRVQRLDPSADPAHLDKRLVGCLACREREASDGLVRDHRRAAGEG